MSLPSFNSNQYFSREWKEKYQNLLLDEHWSFLINRLCFFISNSIEENTLPFFSEEITPPLQPIVNRMVSTFNELAVSLDKDQAWAAVLEESPFEDILVLLGQRRTPGSIIDERAIPPLTETLLESRFESHNKQVSVALRAWEKHTGRTDDGFWGEVKGSPIEKQNQVNELLHRMITEKTWWNVFHHYKHGVVYEIRVSSGHGVRWHNGGKSIIGFLEPFIN